jgi:hypothetical protein
MSETVNNTPAVQSTLSTIGDGIYSAGATVGEWLGKVWTVFYNALPSKEEVITRINDLWEGTKPYISQFIAFLGTTTGQTMLFGAAGLLCLALSNRTEEKDWAKKYVLLFLGAVALVATGAYGASAIGLKV